MLLRQSELPFLAVSGDYYPLSSTPSTFTLTVQSSGLFSFPLPTTAIHNYHLALKRLGHPTSFGPVVVNKPQQSVYDSSGSYRILENVDVMPRQSLPKATEDVNVAGFPAPHVPLIVGGKRDSSGQAVPPRLPISNAHPETEDDPVRLPAKLKETERMMHVQRWINHLPDPPTNKNNPDWIPVYWGYSNAPGFRNIDEDRELTPPPSNSYVSRSPFTTDEEQTLTRFVSRDYRSQLLVSGAVQNSHLANQPNVHGKHRVPVIHEAPKNKHHLNFSNQQTPQDARITDIDPVLRCTPKLESQNAYNGSRFFADWEIRLISHLFHEYFPGRPEPMGNAGVLPSVGEVRARIASSRLNETRSAMAVRAKIKRMQSSGTWIEHQ